MCKHFSCDRCSHSFRREEARDDLVADAPRGGATNDDDSEEKPFWDSLAATRAFTER